MNHDPRNTAVKAPAVVDWEAPSAEDTARFRTAIDRHAGRIELSTDEFGCSIANDTTGQYEVVTLECPEAD